MTQQTWTVAVGRQACVAITGLILVGSAALGQHADTVRVPAAGARPDTIQHRITAHPGIALVVDVDGSGQNRESRVQVGDLPSVGRFRFVRGILEGAVGRAPELSYLISVDASGLYADGSPALTVTDLAVTLRLGGHGHVSVGRQKEGVTEPMMAPSRGIPLAERPAPVTTFVPTRNDGVRFWGSIPHIRGGWTIGAFNDYLFNGLSFRENGGQVAGRAFYAPFANQDTTRAVQIALDGRWTRAPAGMLQFATSPEQASAPNFVNTGPFDARAAFTAVAGLAATWDNLSFTAEALSTRASGTTEGTRRFHGYHAGMSWRPFGEPRPYHGDTGTLGRVRIGRRGVTWELAVGFSHTDLTDGSIRGGLLDIPTIAIGLYGPSSLRILADYGFTILDKDGLTGRAQLATLRFQWER